MNRRILGGLLLLTTCIQCKPAVNLKMPPCTQISGGQTPPSLQAYIKKDICTSCLDLFVAQLHAEKMATQIEFFIQNPDLFQTWKYRYGLLDNIALMDDAMSRCIDTTLAFSTIYHYSDKGEILWTSVLDVDRIPWILEHIPRD